MKTCSAAVFALALLVGCGREEPANQAPDPQPSAVKAEAPAPAAAPAATIVPAKPVEKASPPAASVTTPAAAAATKAAPAAGPRPPETAVPDATPPPTLPPAAARVEAKPPAGPPTAAPKPPGIVFFPASLGKVAFDHPGHAKRLACTACHGPEPPRKIALNKDKAHQLCKGCHEQKAAGPTKCNACHVK